MTTMTVEYGIPIDAGQDMHDIHPSRIQYISAADAEELQRDGHPVWTRTVGPWEEVK